MYQDENHTESKPVKLPRVLLPYVAQYTTFDDHTSLNDGLGRVYCETYSTVYYHICKEGNYVGGEMCFSKVSSVLCTGIIVGAFHSVIARANTQFPNHILHQRL